MKPMSDHDLLIAHSVKIDSLCALMKGIDEKFDKLNVSDTDTHKEIFVKIDRKTEDATFRWLIGLLIIIMMAFASMAGTCLVKSGINDEAIQRIEKAIG